LSRNIFYLLTQNITSSAKLRAPARDRVKDQPKFHLHLEKWMFWKVFSFFFAI